MGFTDITPGKASISVLESIKTPKISLSSPSSKVLQLVSLLARQY